MDLQLLKDLLQTYGPTGHEEKISARLREMVVPYADQVYKDTLGNLIAVKKGNSGKKLMFSAHMDQIGFVVVAIREEGFLHVAAVGGVDPVIAAAREVVFENGVRGVTYFENSGKHGVKDVKFQELYIDIGCSSREAAEKLVHIGDMAVYASNFVGMGQRLSCGALDDRLCCALLAQAFQKLESPHDVYAVFTVQEEVGLRGAGAAAYAVQPDLNISLDVTGAGDIPECDPRSVVLGKGPAIKMMDASVVVAPKVRDFIEGAAREAGIPFQREVLKSGGTDTGAIQRSRGGILSGCISLATRYIHTPVETADLEDAEAAIKLVLACAGQKELPGC